MFAQMTTYVGRGLLPALLATVVCPNLMAFEPGRKLPYTEPSRAERKMSRDFARGGQASDQARAALRKVIETEMSKLTDSELMPSYDTIRSGIYNSYLSNFRPGSEEARQIIVGTVASYGKGIALSADFSPPSRINALALLAELDDMPALKGAPPAPAKDALNPLYQIAADEKAPVYLRCIALYGLQRHIGRFFQDWNGDQRSAIGGTLLKIVDSKPTSDLESAAHNWMVRRAYDCLAATGAGGIVADGAIKRLADPDEFPSLRLTVTRYLSQVSSTALAEEQKKDYLLGLAHFLRSQLVAWYEKEDDLLNRALGATGGGGMYGGSGGMGMGMGGGYGEEGYGGGGYGDGDMDMGGGGGMYGGSGGGGGSSKTKPVDTQDWETLLARRKVNQVAQAVHLCLNGMPVADGRIPRKIGRPLSVGELPEDLQPFVDDLIENLEALQEAVNDAEAITDVNSLLQQAETPIEDIMDLVIEIPGFTDKYPDLAEDEELAHVPDAPAEPPAAAAGDDGAAAQPPAVDQTPAAGEGAEAANAGGRGNRGGGNGGRGGANGQPNNPNGQ